MFHQPHNTFGSKIYNSVMYTDSVYGTHFHKSFELWYCADGEISACADGNDIILRRGQYILVFPYISHSFDVKPPSKLWVAVFSGDYLPELEHTAQTFKPEIKPFFADDVTQAYLSGTLMKHNRFPGETSDGKSDLIIKSGLYAAANAFMKNAAMCRITKTDDTAAEIIRYIENNFTADITLKTAAAALGYNYQHLSRIFRKTLNMNFRSLINQYRFDRACSLIEKGSSVTAAAFDAGFQSVRNFNRIYKEKTGRSPRRDSTETNDGRK